MDRSCNPHRKEARAAIETTPRERKSERAMLRQTDGRAPTRGIGTPAKTIREWDNEHFIHPWESMSGGDADRAIAAGGEGIRIWITKFEAGEYDDEALAADLLQEHEAKVAALERGMRR